MQQQKTNFETAEAAKSSKLHQIVILEDDRAFANGLREHLKLRLNKDIPFLAVNSLADLRGVEPRDDYDFIYLLDMNLGNGKEEEGLLAIHEISGREARNLGKIIVYTGHPHLKKSCIGLGILPEHFVVKGNYEQGLRQLISLIRKIMGIPDDDPDDGYPSEFLPRYDPDSPDGEDRLNITPDVNAFAQLLASKHIEPPLSIGLFGDWGAGKSFFMSKLQQRIATITQRPADNGSLYLQRIAQIRFNAWHYVDTNLWASLIQNIFDQLAVFLDIKQSDEKKLQLLFKEVALIKKQREEAEAKKVSIQKDLDAKQEKITELQADRLEKINELKNVRVFDVLKETFKDERVQKQINDAKKHLGLSDETLIQGLEDVESNLVAYNTTGKRLLRVWEGMSLKDWKYWGLTALFIGAPIGICLLLRECLQNEDIEKTLFEIVAIATGLVMAIAKFFNQAKPAFKKLQDGLNCLDSARTRLRLLAEQKREKDNRKIEQLLHEIQMLGEQQLLVEKDKERLEVQMRQLQQDIENIKAGRDLANFIRRRLESQDYSRQLGIISLIRQDFEDISERLPLKREDNLLQPVERIVLYIDDLDRCKPEKVVEVLQAIHLILAFKLFVVVVGVDIRWVSQAIREEYPLLRLDNGRRESGDAFESGRLSGAPTPFDYLEKIFQIPYWVRRMDVNGVKQLMHKLIEADIQAEDVGHIQPLDNNPASAQTTATTVVKNPIVEPIYQVEKVIITDEEQNYLATVAPLLLKSSPRSIKRFINLLRLVKGHEQGPKTFMEVKATMLLLVLNMSKTNERQQFRRFLNDTQAETLGDLLITLKPREEKSYRWLAQLADMKLTNPQAMEISTESLRRMMPLISCFTFR